MKRLIAIFSIILLLLVGASSSRDAQAANVVRAFTLLTGNTTGAMDKISRTEITDGDIAIVVVDEVIYFYRYGAVRTESTYVPTYIRPADFTSGGVWCLVDIRAKSIIGGRSAEPGVDFYDSDTIDPDTNGRIYLNCTRTTSGAEECDMYFQVQTGGVLVTKLKINSAGAVQIPGILDGLGPVTVTTGDTATLGGTYYRNQTLNNNATAGNATTYTLPTAAAGREECIRNFTGRTGVLRFSISATGQAIDVDGVLTTADTGYVSSGGALGDAACVRGVNATTWILIKQMGTWTRH